MTLIGQPVKFSTATARKRVGLRNDQSDQIIVGGQKRTARRMVGPMGIPTLIVVSGPASTARGCVVKRLAP
jgi:hypothetical protein